jgi:DNA-directed RNA polymerase subunit L
MRNERKSKQLKDFTEDEVAQLRRSFDLLDSERVYIKNPDGTPAVFQMTIDSIGFMPPLQILMSALHMLRLQLCDLKHSIELGYRNQTLDITLGSKLTMFSSPHQENSWVIRIMDEDHTLGNLIGQEVRQLFQEKKELLQYSAYKMNHPLIHNVDIIIVPKLTRNIHIQYISSHYVNQKTFMDLQWSKTFIEQLPDEELYKLASVCYFVSAINRLIEHTNELIGEVGSIDMVEPIMANLDGDSYFNKYADL